jgi:acyl-CoA dehydrogenase
MYTMGTLLRHGSEEQKMRFLPRIASGELRLQAFGVTEPDCGSDTTKLKTKAVRKGDKYVINGQKVFISRVQHSDWMILLARTTPIDQVKKRSEGLSVFMVDLHHAIANGLTVRPIPTMMNHETNELFLQDVEVPVENLIGEEGKGFKYILDGMIAERTMVAGEAIGDGYWFVNRAVKYANERVVFDRPIGKNQGIAFPIAQAYAHVRAADLMRFDAAQKFDAGIPAGTEANLAKHLAAEASWEAADVAMQTLGGYGVAEEYDVERKFRETRLFRIAPLSTNLILSYIAEHVLGLPRSY